MNTSITDKLPIEAIGDTVIDSVHRVGELVPDRVPPAVHAAVSDGVVQGRRIGRQLLDRVPTHQKPRTSRRRIAIAMIALIGVAVVVWRIRSRRTDGVGASRDDWSLHEADAAKLDVA